ncbi:hypothetical protein F5X68DRAFT_173842 [Plectosphaerella plurivora]|uniref:Uncharacterized protein n=1 Tax=Plectosphaerella plurivora TaxID=936078 RepID=A0A9P8V5E6_9PEZI|nr:hypothetical protein F5X68DRAFT_173842 [Plectosphaerella plurivora]
MGGGVFSQGPDPLVTPRMPPSIYQSMSRQCKERLRQLFLCVASPIEAPSKSDYGDLDIFVAWPIRPGSETGPMSSDAKASPLAQQTEAIRLVLGAERYKINSNIAHFAIPWPDQPGPVNGGTIDEPPPKSYVQVDVTIAKSLEEMQWFLFKHAHGDIWSLLGSIIRPYGLTIDELCLSIRIPEMEKTNRKLSRIPLTSEPTEVLSFLGLPVQGFWEHPFSSVDEMFEYVAQCRMFRVSPADAGRPGEERLDPDLDMKADDRKRTKTRPIFGSWMTTFVPRCRLEGRFGAPRTSRDEVKHEALELFRVSNEYQRRLDQHVREQQTLFIKQDIIKTMFPALNLATSTQRALQYRGCLVKALARIVLDDDATYGVLPDPAYPLKNDRGIFDLEHVRRFIDLNHETVGAAAMELHHQAFLGRKRLMAPEQGREG